MVVAVERRVEQLIIERDIGDADAAVAAIPIPLAEGVGRVAVDVADAPLDLRDEVEMGIIFEIQPPLPIVKLVEPDIPG